jgi:hypothetical protein
MKSQSVPPRAIGFSNLFTRWIASRNLIPSVHASAFVDMPNANVIDGVVTSVDQLEAARPSVVVSEDEVKLFIDQETGKDRVRAMFTKE